MIKLIDDKYLFDEECPFCKSRQIDVIDNYGLDNEVWIFRCKKCNKKIQVTQKYFWEEVEDDKYEDV